MSVPIEALDIALEGADNKRLANFAGPMEQNLRHVEERLGVEVRRRGHQLQVLGPHAPLTNADDRGADAGRHIRELAGEKLPQIDALIARARAVKQWLQVAQSCDCSSVDVCGLFVDPTLLPPAGDIELDVRLVRGRGHR